MEVGSLVVGPSVYEIEDLDPDPAADPVSHN
jgi:hypothetical protein